MTRQNTKYSYVTNTRRIKPTPWFDLALTSWGSTRAWLPKQSKQSIRTKYQSDDSKINVQISKCMSSKYGVHSADPANGNVICQYKYVTNKNSFLPEAQSELGCQNNQSNQFRPSIIWWCQDGDTQTDNIPNVFQADAKHTHTQSHKGNKSLTATWDILWAKLKLPIKIFFD